MFSKACEYGIRAALYVAYKTSDGSGLSIPVIAKAIDSPVPFTAKILQLLKREGIIESAKGPNGGFFIQPESKPIPLSKVVAAIDGTDVLHSCSLGLKECSDSNPCPIHNDVKAFKEGLRGVFHEKTLQQLSADIQAGNSFLKIIRHKK